jgi:hypothetical protein
MPGEGGETLGRAIETRALSAGDRIRVDADAAITAPDAAFQQRLALAQERSSKLGLSMTRLWPSQRLFLWMTLARLLLRAKPTR